MPTSYVQRVFLILVILVALAPIGSAGEEAGDSIRDFDLPTLESLGRQIFEQDSISARGTDALFASGFTPEQGEKEGVNGWIVVPRGKGYLVRFVKVVEGALLPAYDIVFDSPNAKGTVSKPAAEPLPEDQAAMYRARQLAIQNIKTYCSKTYNTVVLPDVDGEGYLAYALASTTEPGTMMMGGHVRVTTSPDGKMTERVDRLSRTCAIMRQPETPPGSTAVGMMTTHLVSATPVETHVFLSLHHKKPLFIMASDKSFWKVEDGKVTKMDPSKMK